MVAHSLPNMLAAAAAAAVIVVACSERVESPTAAAPDDGLGGHAIHFAASQVSAQSTDPFSYRATLDPYKIHQLPDFLMHSQATSDVVFQRSVFNPGAGPWHTHPGPSFVFVVEGQIKLERSTKHGCTETPVHSPGAGYFEVADEVHRAVVVSSTPAVLLVTRFNIPPGAPITVPAADPGC